MQKKGSLRPLVNKKSAKRRRCRVLLVGFGGLLFLSPCFLGSLELVSEGSGL